MPQAIEMLTLLRRIDQKLDTAAEFQAFATTRFEELEQANRETRAFQADATARFETLEEANRETRAFQAFATARFDAIDKRLDGHDDRFDQIDKRLDGHDRRFDQIDRRFDAMETRFDRKIDALRTELVDHMERLHQELDMRVREVEAAPRHTRARR